MPDEPLFIVLDEADPEYRATIAEARRTLPEFRQLIQECRSSGAIPCVKTLLVDGDESAPVWLAGARISGKDFLGSVFEIPPQFPSFTVGAWVRVPEGDVLDWMVNTEGVLRGGFSLRYQRSKLPPDQHRWYDEYVGVKRYS